MKSPHRSPRSKCSKERAIGIAGRKRLRTSGGHQHAKKGKKKETSGEGDSVQSKKERKVQDSLKHASCQRENREKPKEKGRLRTDSIEKVENQRTAVRSPE